MRCSMIDMNDVPVNVIKPTAVEAEEFLDSEVSARSMIDINDVPVMVVESATAVETDQLLESGAATHCSMIDINDVPVMVVELTAAEAEELLDSGAATRCSMIDMNDLPVKVVESTTVEADKILDTEAATRGLMIEKPILDGEALSVVIEQSLQILDDLHGYSNAVLTGNNDFHNKYDADIDIYNDTTDAVISKGFVDTVNQTEIVSVDPFLYSADVIGIPLSQLLQTVDTVNNSSNYVDINSSTSTTNNVTRERSRVRNKARWVCQMRKRLKNNGSSYVSRKGKVKREKMLKPGCGIKCRQKCHARVTFIERVKIFTQFWQLGSLNAQRQFLVTHALQRKTKPKQTGSIQTKNKTIDYCLHVDGVVIKVCKTFFLHTLDISDQTVLTTLSKISSDGHLLPDQRKQPARCRLPESVRESIRNHINKFQTVPSHYCRQTSSKLYLPETLTITEMFRLYEQECRETGTISAKKGIYFDVFHKDFNLAFHRPKKDLCDFCEKYSRSDNQEKDEMKDKMTDHLKRKTLSRELKEKEKVRAQNDNEVDVSCFDLQQVLVTPHSMSAQLYYRRKLATYNLTVFDIGKNKGHCYMWHEGVAKRGSSNISSCVWKYMSDKLKNNEPCKEFVFFSDNCSGQNKNKAVAGMYMHATLSLNVARITHYFLEPGHTQNEGDSMHAVIEKASKRANIYSPVQWYTLASTAKKSGSPYTVNEMEGNMMDFKLLGEGYCKNLREAVSRKVPQWQKIRAMRVEKESPHVLFVKYSFDDDESFIPLVDRSPDCELYAGVSLLPIANESTVTEAKKKDLLYMCHELIIPKEYHNFYTDLVLEGPESNELPPAETLSSEHNDISACDRSEQPNCHTLRNSRKRKRGTQTAKKIAKKTKSTAGSSNTF